MTELDEQQARRIAHADLATRALVVAAIVLAIVVAGLQLQMTLRTNRIASSIAEQQKEAVHRSRDIKRLATIIESCTNPKGACAQRGRRQTGRYIGSINTVVILAAACAKQPGNTTIPQIQACVQRNLPPGDHGPTQPTS